MDNFNNYYPVSIKEARHVKLDVRDGCTAIRGNLSDYKLLTAIFEQHNFDSVFHLAAQAISRLGYQPSRPLKDALQKFVDWFRYFRGDNAS